MMSPTNPLVAVDSVRAVWAKPLGIRVAVEFRLVALHRQSHELPQSRAFCHTLGQDLHLPAFGREFSPRATFGGTSSYWGGYPISASVSIMPLTSFLTTSFLVAICWINCDFVICVAIVAPLIREAANIDGESMKIWGFRQRLRQTGLASLETQIDVASPCGPGSRLR